MTPAKTLRQRLGEPTILVVPGAGAPLDLRLIEQTGFEAAYISGYATAAARHGLPDVGLIAYGEVEEMVRAARRVTDLPLIVDCDTGYGDVANVRHTVRGLERLGVAAVQIEDQVWPKRCGHMDGKVVEPAEVAERKIRAAVASRRDRDTIIVARTDARAVEGMDAAIERARAYVEAGAEMIFPEAMADEEEFAEFRTAIDVPLLANMTEFGKSKLLNARKLEQLGYSIVIYPVTTLRLAMKAVEEGLHTINERGDQIHLLERMQHRDELYDLLDYEAYQAFDDQVSLSASD
jgi:methylisocitrate lyase